MNIMPMTHFAIAALHQLFKNGPTWDGNLVSKTGRTELVALGYAEKVDGFNFLTSGGVSLAVEPFGREKF